LKKKGRLDYSLAGVLAFLEENYGITDTILEKNNDSVKFPIYQRSSYSFHKTMDREYLFHQIIEDMCSCISGRSNRGSIREKNPLLIVGGGPGRY
jgi:hypothetical protein